MKLIGESKVRGLAFDPGGEIPTGKWREPKLLEISSVYYLGPSCRRISAD